MLLLTGSPVGTYLGRMSMSDPGSFSISYVTHDGVVDHALIKYIPEAEGGPSVVLVEYRFLIRSPNSDYGVYLSAKDPTNEDTITVYPDLCMLVQDYGDLFQIPFEGRHIRNR